MILTASLFPFLCFSIGLVLNTIAIFYRSLAAIPFGTMVVIFVLWAFISFPLVLLGTVVGRNWSGAPNNPCRVKTIPRPIPEKKWYLTPSVISWMGGLLPFGSIFIEMYFVFTSFWNYKVKKNYMLVNAPPLGSTFYSKNWHLWKICTTFLIIELGFQVNTSKCVKSLSLKECWVRLFCCLAGVLCVWLHAAGVCHPYNSHHMCHYCGYLFLVECWELSLAMDIILLCCFYRLVCIFILHILLSCEDKDVRLLPDKLLLWLHPDVLSWIGNTLRWALKLTFVHFISSIHLSYFDIHSVLYEGAVGYVGSTLFVRRIYRNIKCD